MIARLFSVSAWPVGSARTALTVAGSFARAHEFLYAIFSGTTDRNVGLPPIIVAHASGRREKALATEAIRKAHARSRGRPVPWRSDGRRAYLKAITHVYRRPARTGRRGRPPLRLPEGISLTQTIKHRAERGRPLGVEVRATIGAAVERPALVHGERLNGVLRDQLACLTRKTQPFAKTASAWNAPFGLALLEHNWLRVHPALGQPNSTVPGRCHERRTPAMPSG